MWDYVVCGHARPVMVFLTELVALHNAWKEIIFITEDWNDLAVFN